MSPQVVFLCAVGAYLLICYFLIRNKKFASSMDFFTKTNPRILWFSLLASSLTVSGGIFALLSAVNYYKIWIFILPISYAAGMFSYFFIAKNLIKTEHNKDIDIFNKIDEYTSNKYSPYNFKFFFSISTILIAVLALGWEFYVGSKFISLAILKTESIYYSFAVALFIAIVINVYSYIRGYDAVVKSDLIQSVSALAVIVALALVVRKTTGTMPTLTLDILRPAVTFKDLIIFTITMFIINSLFQIYNVVNMNILRSINELKETYIEKIKLFKNTFLIAGSLLCIIWVAIIVSGFIINAERPEDIVKSADNIETFFFLLGITAFFISTVDSVSFGIVNLIDTSFLQFQKAPLIKKKAITPFITLLSLSFAFILMDTNPNIFYALIRLGSCMAVFFPVFIILSFNHNKTNAFLGRSFSRPFTAKLLFGLFILSCVAQFIFAQNYTFLIVLCTFVSTLIILLVGYSFDKFYR